MRSAQGVTLNNVLSFGTALLNAETVNTEYYSALDLFYGTSRRTVQQQQQVFMRA
jgi:hypothetical protein